MHLRKLTENGIEELRAILHRARDTKKFDNKACNALLQSPSETQEVFGGIEIDPNAKFDTRFEAAKYLFDCLENVPKDELRDKGLWAWIALCWLDQICLTDGTGGRIVRDETLYIPDFSNYLRDYRHLLYGPFSVYRQHAKNPKIAMAVLCQPLQVPGELVENLASRQVLISSPVVMEVATQLYGNPKTGKLKKGAGRKNKGGSRRFAALMNQFDLTYDLDQISPKNLVNMLPEEFDEFKSP